MTDPIGTAQERELIERLLDDDEMLERLTYLIQFYVYAEAEQKDVRDLVSSFGADDSYSGYAVVREADVERINDALQSRIAEVGRLTDALNAIHEARLHEHGRDEGYGWSITKLNRAMDAALPLLGKPVPPPMLTDEQVANAHAALSLQRRPSDTGGSYSCHSRAEPQGRLRPSDECPG